VNCPHRGNKESLSHLHNFNIEMMSVLSAFSSLVKATMKDTEMKELSHLRVLLSSLAIPPLFLYAEA
jgi:hypothetical protein